MLGEPIKTFCSRVGDGDTYTYKNIARGTTDPKIDSVTWIKFSNNMAPLALVAYFTTRWRLH